MDRIPKRLNAEAYLGEIQRIFGDPDITAEQAAALKAQVSGGEPWSNVETITYIVGQGDLEKARAAYFSTPSAESAETPWESPTKPTALGVTSGALGARSQLSLKSRPTENIVIEHLEK